MSGEIDGTLTRQLLPFDVRSDAKSTDVRKLWRYVTWAVEPINRHEARAHLRLAFEDGGCIVWVKRGPKGGWTGARFYARQDMMKIPINHSLHYGWVHRDKHCRDTMPAEEQWRATLALHTP